MLFCTAHCTQNRSPGAQSLHNVSPKACTERRLVSKNKTLRCLSSNGVHHQVSMVNVFGPVRRFLHARVTMCCTESRQLDRCFCSCCGRQFTQELERKQNRNGWTDRLIG